MVSLKMKANKIQVQIDQQERIRLGNIARDGKNSEFWLEILKPIIESQIMGITDISSIDISSEKKASIELAGRKLAARYLQETETLIDGFVIDADTILSIADKQKKSTPLYKTEE